MTEQKCPVAYDHDAVADDDEGCRVCGWTSGPGDPPLGMSAEEVRGLHDTIGWLNSVSCCGGGSTP